MCAIDRQSRGLFARFERPAARDDELVCVDLRQLARVFDVHVNMSLAVAHRELRLAAEGDGAGDGIRRGVDHRRVLAGCVEREDARRRWIEEDRVRTIAGRLDLGQRLE